MANQTVANRPPAITATGLLAGHHERFGARKWIAGIMLSWGILSGTMAFLPFIARQARTAPNRGANPFFGRTRYGTGFPPENFYQPRSSLVTLPMTSRSQACAGCYRAVA